MEQETHILLIRHGLTDANAGNVIQGHRPTPLNAVGHAQAKRLAERMPGYRPAVQRLIASDLPRAEQTARPIAAACGLELAFDATWRERRFGALEGKTAAECEIWRAAAGETDPPGAESAQAFTARVEQALWRVARKEAGRTVAVVTHGGPCRAVLRMLIDGRLPLQQGADRPELVMIANCSIMHLVFQAGLWRIVALNDVVHLADLGGSTLRDAG